MAAEVRIGSVSDFPDGGLAGVEADGHRLIVARVGDEVLLLATDARIWASPSPAVLVA